MRPLASIAPARLLSLTGALALLAAACADRSGPTAPAGPLVPPTLDAATAARGGGAEIVRLDEGNAAWFGGDPRDGLAVIVWTEDESPTADALCAFLTTDGAPLPATSPQRTQLVFTPKGRFNLTTVSRVARVEVYQYGGSAILSPCELVGAPVVATGTVRATLHQVDPGAADPGLLKFHSTVTGVVDLVSGGQARLHATARFRAASDGTIVMNEASVELTPR